MAIKSEELENEHRIAFMVRHTLAHATWDVNGHLSSATRSITVTAPTGLTLGQQPPAAPRAERTGGAEGLERMRKVMLEKRRAEHNVRFAHSHVKPRFEDDPEPVRDDVPRAIRAREAERAATPKRTTNRKTKR